MNQRFSPKVEADGLRSKPGQCDGVHSQQVMGDTRLGELVDDTEDKVAIYGDLNER